MHNMKFPHWQYFIALDTALLETTRYVELSEANFSVFSIEYARILLSTASEVDVVCKLLCDQISPTSKAENIDEYRKVILACYPKFPSIRIQVPRLETEITPWDAWDNGNNPDWWRNHNRVKHERGTYFEEANLKNSLYALGGLFAILLYFYQPDAYKGDLHPFPKLVDYHRFPGYLVTNPGMVLPDFPRS
jgi:hypothetical protein